MKLSEAILLGSVGTEQATGMLRTLDGRTCALGAALVGCGYTFSEPALDDVLGYMHIEQKWPWTRKAGVHPIYGSKNADVLDIIWNLNDCHNWTRPQIAAWIASIEPQDEEQKVVTNGGHIEEEVQPGPVRA